MSYLVHHCDPNLTADLVLISIGERFDILLKDIDHIGLDLF